MTDYASLIEEARLIRERKYLQAKKLPLFYNKYSKYFNKEYVAACKIQNFVKKYVLCDVVNQDELDTIQPSFRKRILLDDSNRIDNIDQFKQFDIIDQLNFVPFEQDDIDPFDTFDDNNNYNEQLDDLQLQQFIHDSVVNVQDQNIVVEEPLKFSICIDLYRVWNNLSEPIIYMDKKYILNEKQKKDILKQWNKVNPETTTGQMFHQNLEYQRGYAFDRIGKSL